MSRIVITTFGSAGDLNPYLAVGLGLRARGHTVVFAVEENFAVLLRDQGFEVALLSGSSAAVMQAMSGKLFHGSSPAASLRILLNEYILPLLPGRIEELRAACAGADLLVSAALQFAASFVADLTGMPWASLILSPITLPSAAIEPAPLPFKLPSGMKRASNRLGWWAGGMLFRPLVDGPVNTLRRRYDLPPRHNLLWEGNLSHQYTALAVARAFLGEIPADWPDSVSVTGFCFWDTPADWQPAPELAAFLRGDAPVIAVTAGSMAGDMGDAFATYYQTCLAGIRAMGARALLIGASSELAQGDDALAIPFAPYSYVVPRSAALVQHGGIGTTAQALRYGVPSLIIPWGVDQFYTAAQMAQIGAGRWLARRQLTPAQVAAALQALIGEPRYRATLSDIQAQIAAEDGVSAICAALEGVMG